MTNRRTFLQTASGLAAAQASAQTAESDRQYWVRMMAKIAEPVLANLAAGTLKRNMPVETTATNVADRRKYTHLEAIGRLLSGIAPWLEALLPAGPERELQQRYADLARHRAAHERLRDRRERVDHEARQHENDLFVFRHVRERGAKARQQRYDKTERGRERSLGCRHDLMECAAGKAAVRQVAIKCGKTEGKLVLQNLMQTLLPPLLPSLLLSLRPPWMPRQQKAQFGYRCGSAFGRGCGRKDRQNRHLTLFSQRIRGRYSGYVPEPNTRTKREQSKRQKVRDSQPIGTFSQLWRGLYFRVGVNAASGLPLAQPSPINR